MISLQDSGESWDEVYDDIKTRIHLVKLTVLIYTTVYPGF